MPEGTKTILDMLNEPLDKTRIKYRKGFGGGGDLAYVEAYDVIDAANRIFNYQWSDRLLNLEYLGESPILWKALVEVTAMVDGVETTHSDVGIGITRLSNGEIKSEAIEMASKGAVTDAFKRAIRKFGPQFGNSLYDKDATSADASSNGSSSFNAPRATPSSNGNGSSYSSNNGASSSSSSNGSGSAWNDNWTMMYGSAKGQKVSDLSLRDLKWYRGGAVQNLEDPSKAQYAARSQALIEAIDARLQSMGEEIPGSPQESYSPIGVEPPAPKLNEAQRNMLSNYAKQLFGAKNPYGDADTDLDKYCQEAFGKAFDDITPTEGRELNQMLQEEMQSLTEAVEANSSPFDGH